MTEMLVNWVVDRFASTDIIDLYFVVSELVDIHLTEKEICETAYFNSLANHTASCTKLKQTNITPLGKLVV